MNSSNGFEASRPLLAFPTRVSGYLGDTSAERIILKHADRACRRTAAGSSLGLFLGFLPAAPVLFRFRWTMSDSQPHIHQAVTGLAGLALSVVQSPVAAGDLAPKVDIETNACLQWLA
jgi:hypothetical protein